MNESIRKRSRKKKKRLPECRTMMMMMMRKVGAVFKGGGGAVRGGGGGFVSRVCFNHGLGEEAPRHSDAFKDSSTSTQIYNRENCQCPPPVSGEGGGTSNLFGGFISVCIHIYKFHIFPTKMACRYIFFQNLHIFALFFLYTHSRSRGFRR